MSRPTLLFSALFVLATVLPAPAQQQLEIPGGGPLPTKPLFKPKTQKIWAVRVAYAGPPLLKPHSTANRAKNRNLIFMDEQYVVTARHVSDEKPQREYLLLAQFGPNGEDLGETFGWVPADWTVQQPYPLKDINNIYRKAMIVNKAPTIANRKPLFQLVAGELAKKLDGKLLPVELRQAFAEHKQLLSAKATAEVRVAGEGWTVVDEPNSARYSVRLEDDKLTVFPSLKLAAVFDGPEDGARMRTRFQLFNIFFVYGETATHVLIGTQLSLGDEPSKAVKGWIPKNRVTPWNTREALEWDYPSTVGGDKRKRKEAGHIWLSPQDANAFLDRKKVDGENPEAAFNESVDLMTGLSQPFGPGDMRFPILEGMPLTRHKSGNELLRVGWVGGLSTPAGGKGMTREELNDLKEQLVVAQKKLKLLEIVFVIDDTESMEPYFKATGEVVEAIVKEAQVYRTKDKDRRVRIAVCYYNDYIKSNKNHRPTKTMLLKEASDKATMDKLIKQTKEHDYKNGGLPHEEVFLGITDAIDQTGASLDARKLMIVIGDAGDNSYDDKDLEATKKKEILEKLVPNPKHGTPWEFYAIQMEIHKQKRPDEAVSFERQMKSLVDMVNNQVKGRRQAEYLHAAGNNTTGVIAKMKDLIAKRFAHLNQQVSEWDAAINALRSGEWHTVIGPGLRRYLEENYGVTNVDRLKTLEGMQIYQEGFVWKNAPIEEGAPGDVEQVRPMVLLNDGEILDVVRLLETLLNDVEDKGNSSLTKLLVSQLKSMAGENEKITTDRNIDDVFQKVHGLKFHTKLLKRAVSQITEVKAEEKKYLEYRLLKLRDLLNDERKEWVWGKKKLATKQLVPGWIVAPGSQADDEGIRVRHFTIPGDSKRWFWVDSKEELP